MLYLDHWRASVSRFWKSLHILSFCMEQHFYAPSECILASLTAWPGRLAMSRGCTKGVSSTRPSFLGRISTG